MIILLKTAVRLLARLCACFTYSRAGRSSVAVSTTSTSWASGASTTPLARWTTSTLEAERKKRQRAKAVN